MIDSQSRYRAVGTSLYKSSDGSTIAYLNRRFLPQSPGTPVVARIVVAAGDRLDLMAARTLGDPCWFWQIADANLAMDPFTLTDKVGRILIVTRASS